MADPAPPPEVLFAFVRQLNATVAEFEETLVPVLRGSLLLRHWFGDRARPAADLDLECFERPADPDPDADPAYPRPEGGHGRHGEFVSLVDFGKAMCRYTAEFTRYDYAGRSIPAPDVVFERTEPPEGGNSLWVYGTPGERYYAGWKRGGTRRVAGRMQIDIAAAGDYALADLPLTDVPLAAPGGPVVRCPAYAPETLLAAKVSWLVRSFKRDAGGARKWSGEPKDLFDAHLLLTEGDPSAERFRQALTAVGAQDGLDWGDLDTLLAGGALADADFGNWPAFAARHPGLSPAGPAALLGVVAARLEPLLGDFYRRDEMPFLRKVRDDGPDAGLTLLVYADWLDEHGHDGRAALLRRLVDVQSGESDDLPALAAALGGLPEPWLLQVFGTSANLREIRAAGGPPA